MCISTLTAEAISMGAGDGAISLCSEEIDDNDEEDRVIESSRGEDRPPDDGETDDEEELQRRTAAAAAALLRRKRGSRSGVRAVKPLKNTSVGKRRVGSATRARASQGGTSKIMDAVRNVAGAAAAASTSSPERTNSTARTADSKSNSTSSGMHLGSNVIQATIASLLEGQDAFKKTDGSVSMNAFPRPFGIFGEEPDPLSHELLRNPMPGTMLLYPTTETREYQRPSRETLSVRVATPDDDLQIAHLRLSVFSDFSTELRSQFCARSCQVLADRRLRGATCLVATTPSGRTSPHDVVMGSVECSVHEFFATKLGRRRPKYSLLYVTEVAVSPSARRCGVGSKLLQGVDELALLRNVESLYLHVDVLNFGALELYRKAGYSKVHSADPMYAEFTTTLNLHDGATKGRRHYLLCKHLARDPTWLPTEDENKSSPSKIDTFTWGFENILS